MHCSASGCGNWSGPDSSSLFPNQTGAAPITNRLMPGTKRGVSWRPSGHGATGGRTSSRSTPTRTQSCGLGHISTRTPRPFHQTEPWSSSSSATKRAAGYEWFRIEDRFIELCLFDPGFDIDLVVRIEDPVPFAQWHAGLIECATSSGMV